MKERDFFFPCHHQRWIISPLSLVYHCWRKKRLKRKKQSRAKKQFRKWSLALLRFCLLMMTTETNWMDEANSCSAKVLESWKLKTKTRNWKAKYQKPNGREFFYYLVAVYNSVFGQKNGTTKSSFLLQILKRSFLSLSLSSAVLHKAK